MRVIIESTKVSFKDITRLQKFDRSQYLANFNSFQMRVREGNYIMYLDKLRIIQLQYLNDTNYRITEDFEDFLNHVEQMALMKILD